MVYLNTKMYLKKPKQAANFEEIGPENDPANFLLFHLTNHYSVNMAGAQQTGRHSPTGDEKFKISHMRLGRNDVKFTQQVGEYALNRQVKFDKESIIFSSIFSLWHSSWKIFEWKFVGPYARAWGSMGLYFKLRVWWHNIISEFQWVNSR